MLSKINSTVCAVVLLGLVVRLCGIDFQVPHPDDYITVQGAMHFGLTRLEPTGYGLYGLYVWPAFSIVHILVALYGLYFAVGWLVGVFPNIEAFRSLYLADPSSFHLIGRVMSVLFGVGTVWILYYLGRKLYNHRAGVLAALFLSVSFIHSFHSQFIRPDVPSTFFIVLATVCCLFILDSKGPKYYIYAGVLAGIATATKFTSAIIVVSVLAAHILAEGRRLLDDKGSSKVHRALPIGVVVLGIALLAGSVSVSRFRVPDLSAMRFSVHEGLNQQVVAFLGRLSLAAGVLGLLVVLAGLALGRFGAARNVLLSLLSSRRLVLGLSAAPLGFMLFDPLFFLDLKNQVRIFITDPNFMGQSGLFVGVDSLGFWGDLWWYVKGPLSWGPGLHIGIMAALGLLWTLYQKRREELLVLVFPAVYLLVVCFGKMRWERYAVALMPFTALYAASFLDTVLERTLPKRLPVRSKNAAAWLITVAIVALPAYNILRYDYLLRQEDTRTTAERWVESNLPPGSRIGQDAYTGDLPDTHFQITKKFSLSSAPVDYYIEHGYQYLLVSDTQYRRYLAEPNKYPENAAFYRRLFSECALVKEFRPRDDLWPRPEVRFPKYHIHISPTIRVYGLGTR